MSNPNKHHPDDEESILDDIGCPVLKAAWQNHEDARQECAFQRQTCVITTAEEVAAAKQRFHDAGELFHLVLEYHHKHGSKKG